MDYNALSVDYREKQLQRLRGYLSRIANKETLLGRALPTEDSLSIGESRRIAAAVLFVDICGFSSRALETQQDQDRTFRALALFFAEMARICKDYGGGVEKNTGDGLMAWFRDGDGTRTKVGVRPRDRSPFNGLMTRLRARVKFRQSMHASE